MEDLKENIKFALKFTETILIKYKRFIKFLMFLSCAVFYGLLCQLKIESQWVLVAKILSGGIMAFTGIKLLEKK